MNVYAVQDMTALKSEVFAPSALVRSRPRVHPPNVEPWGALVPAGVSHPIETPPPPTSILIPNAHWGTTPGVLRNKGFKKLVPPGWEHDSRESRTTVSHLFFLAQQCFRVYLQFLAGVDSIDKTHSALLSCFPLVVVKKRLKEISYWGFQVTPWRS